MDNARDWDDLVKRHKAFWSCSEVYRPLIQVTYNDYVDTELVASVMGDGELKPHSIDPSPILSEYDKVAVAREMIGDDTIGVAEPLLGIPWLEAICGCQVMVADSKSIWPEPTENSIEIRDISFSEDNAWFQKLLEVLQVVVDYVGGRYAVGISHLRGPTDILIALLGPERFFLSFFDDPECIKHLAKQAAEVWLKVVRAETQIVPPYRGGYGVRQFGLWAPERAVWLQDDTAGMMSVDHYRQFFLKPMRSMSVLPHGVLHLHIPSLHLVETLAEVPNIRAVNLYFDSEAITLQDAMPTLRRLQARSMPLILAKDVYKGFSWEEYEEIMESLSPRGLTVHLQADSVEEGRAVMKSVEEMTYR